MDALSRTTTFMGVHRAAAAPQMDSKREGPTHVPVAAVRLWTWHQTDSNEAPSGS